MPSCLPAGAPRGVFEPQKDPSVRITSLVSGLGTKLLWGSIYRTISKKLGGPQLGQRTILKNGGTNSRATDTPPNYRLIADPETWIAR